MAEHIDKDKFVSLIYTISDDNDVILERNDVPIQFIFGRNGEVIKKIEQALEGHVVGDRVSVRLNPAEGFGEYQPELTFSDDITNVPPQFRTIGAEIEFKNDHGEVKIFRVTRIADGKLSVDGNHPFAGMHVTYTITVVALRDATPEEIVNFVKHAPVLH
jgi:FKBP-type peptidyl-prolyl cis-trans isomerase SlyD